MITLKKRVKELESQISTATPLSLTTDNPPPVPVKQSPPIITPPIITNIITEQSIKKSEPEIRLSEL
jgi:hypothetical protein